MRKDFMWYYSVIILSYMNLTLLWDVFTLADADSFWAIVIVLPILAWIVKKAK